jgi:L-ascorbate metabolism protein UlaG (beta-lactamase superfamily)
MDITWLGHSCFRLHDADMIVITDPFPASLGLKPDTRPSSVVTISNPHPNHGNWQEVPGDPKVFSAPGEYEYNDVTVRGVMTPLGDDTPQEQRNVAYSIEIDGISICHLGDISSPLTTRQVDDLKPVEVLFVPVGGRCTLEIDQVYQTLQDLDPKIVIPMHYETPGVKVELDGLDPFVRRMGLELSQPQPRVVVTTGNLPADMRITTMTVQSRPLP